MKFRFCGHYYFFLKILETEHDRKESNYCVRVPPAGTAHRVKASKPVLCPVPGHVCYHRRGEPSHHRPHLPGPPPPHTHVFVSQQPVFLWPLLLLCHNAQIATGHAEPRPVHLLSWLPDTNVLLPVLCRPWGLPPCGHGLWPLCGHLLPPALHCHHEPQALSLPGGAALGADHIPCHVTHPANGQAALLWRQSDPPLFLWLVCSAEAVLLWHSS